VILGGTARDDFHPGNRVNKCGPSLGEVSRFAETHAAFDVTICASTDPNLVSRSNSEPNRGIFIANGRRRPETVDRDHISHCFFQHEPLGIADKNSEYVLKFLGIICLPVTANRRLAMSRRHSISPHAIKIATATRWFAWPLPSVTAVFDYDGTPKFILSETRGSILRTWNCHNVGARTHPSASVRVR